MNLGALISQCRFEAGDLARPYFLSDEQGARYANEAQNEAARRAGLLVDSTSDFCQVETSDAVVMLDRRIIDVMRIRSGRELLPLVTCAEMDCRAEQWESDAGEPQAVVTDYQTSAIRLWPAPNGAVQLSMTVKRLPLSEMAQEDDEPEIRPEYHDALVQWMLHRFYAIQDADTFDPNKSAIALANFEREFGRRASARNEHWQREQQSILSRPVA